MASKLIEEHKTNSITSIFVETMTMMSNLPRDLVGEILYRVPAKSMRAMQHTCLKWNTLSKDESFRKKHLALEAASSTEREFMVVMVMDFRFFLMSIDLNGIDNEFDSCMEYKGKLKSLADSEKLDVSQVYHCDGLLLCITKHYRSFMVLNPYWGQSQRFEPIICHSMFRYAIGYEDSKTCRRHKVLRFAESWSFKDVRIELYYVNSKSCKSITVPSDWIVLLNQRGVSVKGKTYWFAKEKYPLGNEGDAILHFLLCFDFTTEKFGPRLPLPFQFYYRDAVTLSSVRDEQVAVLFQRRGTLQMKIWITTKIGPEEVSWSKLFLAVDMEPVRDPQLRVDAGSFFVDEEKKIAVIFVQDIMRNRYMAYFIGEDGYFKRVDCRDCTKIGCCPFMCPYVPSAAQIQY